MVAYLREMGSLGRLIVVNNGNREIGWVTFFLLESVDQADAAHERPMWSTFIDCPQGRVIYIDKMVCGAWDKELRILFQREVLKQFPELETAVWFRASQTGPDHKVVRRIQCHRLIA